MLPASPLDHHLVSEAPSPLFIGELPRRWEEIPARVVINLCGSWPAGDPYGRVSFAMPMIDALDPEVVPRRTAVEKFLTSVHEYAAGHPTYWHCHAGLNRSGFAVAAYLHVHRGMRISEAIATLRERRSPIALCNHAFERTLREWYGGPDEQAFELIAVSDWLGARKS
jgi:hypothetical protein